MGCVKHLGAVFCHVCFPHDCNDYDADDSDVMMMMMTVMVLGSSFTTTNNAFGEISLFFGSFQGCLVAWVVVVCISFPGLLAFTALSLILIHITVLFSGNKHSFTHMHTLSPIIVIIIIITTTIITAVGGCCGKWKDGWVGYVSW